MNFKTKENKLLKNSYKTYNPNIKNSSTILDIGIPKPANNSNTNNNNLPKSSRVSSKLVNIKHQTIDSNIGSISHRTNKSCNRLNINETSSLKKKTGSVKRVNNILHSIIDKPNILPINNKINSDSNNSNIFYS
jgi:hypothetical protein